MEDREKIEANIVHILLIALLGAGAYWLVSNGHPYWACLVSMILGFALCQGADPE